MLVIALAACIAPGLLATDFEVSGQHEVRVVTGSVNSTVMITAFTLTCIGTNWAISTFYTNTWARAVTRDCVASVDGRSYTAEWYGNGTCGGLVMDRPLDRLDAASELVRLLVEAFLTSKERPESVSNAPVGFLHPRHPGLHCYRREVAWSSETPSFPERIRYRLDDRLCDQVPREVVSYFFRSGYGDRSLFRRWRETQKSGADYSVSAWTNWGELRLPQRAILTHTHFEHFAGERLFPRMHMITVTNVQGPSSEVLVPTLLPGSSVQDVADEQCYLYTSTDGTFLPIGQAKSVGTLLTKAPLPGPVAAFNGMRSVPWPALLWTIAALLVGSILAGIAWYWFAGQR